MASKQWTDADEKAFQEMALRRSSRQEPVIPVAVKSAGTMSDASKRRATELKVGVTLLKKDESIILQKNL